MLSRAGARDERGAVLVLMAIMLTLLMAFSALAIDIGYGREKKRQIQSAADAGALAAAQELLKANGTAGASTTAQDIVDKNLGQPAGWLGCADSGALVSPGSNGCVSFDSAFTTVRVRVPTQTMPTFFARVIGVDNLKASAIAEARIRAAGGTVQPFWLGPGATGEVCLKSSGANNPDPMCAGSSSPGNFGTLDMARYIAVGGVGACTGGYHNAGNPNAVLTDNIAAGVDHVVTKRPDGTATVTDEDCPQGPNSLSARTGNASAFDSGMLADAGGPIDDGGPGRLLRAPDGVSWDTRTVAGHSGVDNVPLWRFIDPGATGIPPGCSRSAFASLDAAHDQHGVHDLMKSCIDQYGTGSWAPLFSANTLGTEHPLDLYDIQRSPRFGYVATFAATPTGASGTLPVQSFEPIFLETLYGSCSAASCNHGFAFEPGSWNPSSVGNGGDHADSVTAWVIPPNMLPAGIDQPNVLGSTAFVELVK